MISPEAAPLLRKTHEEPDRADCIIGRTTCITGLSVSAAVLAAFGRRTVRAAELIILASQGSISGARDLAAAFRAATGHKVIATPGARHWRPSTPGRLRLTSPNPPVIDDLIKQGKVVGQRVDFARAGIGVADQGGRAEAAAEQHRRVRAHAAQRQVDRLFDGRFRLDGGQHHQEPRPHRGAEGADEPFLDGFPAAEAVARGEVEIALQQINVILPVAGAELAGPLPPELQRYNHFAVGVLAGSKQREVAAAMVKFMGAPENAAVVRNSGLEPPAR